MTHRVSPLWVYLICTFTCVVLFNYTSVISARGVMNSRDFNVFTGKVIHIRPLYESNIGEGRVGCSVL